VEDINAGKALQGLGIMHAGIKSNSGGFRELQRSIQRIRDGAMRFYHEPLPCVREADQIELRQCSACRRSCEDCSFSKTQWQKSRGVRVCRNCIIVRESNEKIGRGGLYIYIRTKALGQ
jgi:hypothetical protein